MRQGKYTSTGRASSATLICIRSWKEPCRSGYAEVPLPEIAWPSLPQRRHRQLWEYSSKSLVMIIYSHQAFHFHSLFAASSIDRENIFKVCYLSFVHLSRSFPMILTQPESMHRPEQRLRLRCFRNGHEQDSLSHVAWTTSQRLLQHPSTKVKAVLGMLSKALSLVYVLAVTVLWSKRQAKRDFSWKCSGFTWARKQRGKKDFGEKCLFENVLCNTEILQISLCTLYSKTRGNHLGYYCILQPSFLSRNLLHYIVLHL